MAFSMASRDYTKGLTEIMDRPQPVSSKLRADLTNLEALNRFFGSYSLTLRFLRRWLRPGASATILDLCTGSADIPRLVARWARSNDVKVQVTAVDFQKATLAIARERCRPADAIELVHADVFQYDPGMQFDLVFCSLALHHFTEERAQCLLERIRRLSRRRALVADLRRSTLGTIGVHLLTETIFRAPMTRFDARLSMRRAFSFDELHRLAERAGWTGFGHRRFRFSRQAIWLE
jgi:ubiquinone/menaquinone biosynthesis C-methylase UbiE